MDSSYDFGKKGPWKYLSDGHKKSGYNYMKGF